MPTYRNYTRTEALSTSLSCSINGEVGDFLVAFLCSENTNETHTVPTGWELVDTLNHTTRMQASLFTKVATQDDLDNGVSLTGSAGNQIRRAFVVSVADANAVDDSGIEIDNTVTGPLIYYPQLTTTEDDSVLLFFSHAEDSDSRWFEGGITTVYQVNNKKDSLGRVAITGSSGAQSASYWQRMDSSDIVAYAAVAVGQVSGGGSVSLNGRNGRRNRLLI